MAHHCRPLAFLCCLLLPPLDTLPFLEVFLEISVTDNEDDDSSLSDADRILDLGGESVRSSRRQVLNPCAAVLEIISRRPGASCRGQCLAALPGCEHGRRNGLGTPLRC
jgi:hypothetical protein